MKRVFHYNKNVPVYKKKRIPALVEIARDFLATIYPRELLYGIDYIFTEKASCSRFYRNISKIRVVLRSRLGLYHRKTIGNVANDNYATWLTVGWEIQTTCAIVHELTHHVQWQQGRQMSEVETTTNEILYLRKHQPYWFDKVFTPDHESTHMRGVANARMVEYGERVKRFEQLLEKRKTLIEKIRHEKAL